MIYSFSQKLATLPSSSIPLSIDLVPPFYHPRLEIKKYSSLFPIMKTLNVPIYPYKSVKLPINSNKLE